MKEILITKLRNKETPIEEYRQAAEQLGLLLAVESMAYLPKRKISIETPLQKTEGICFENEVLLVPILRSGLILLNPFLAFYPKARVGFLGVRRDEETCKPELYYKKLPAFGKDASIILLDPMVATGGSAHLAVQELIKAGAKEEQILQIALIAAPEGIEYFKKQCPKVAFIAAQIDKCLNEHGCILPGLGDFGDRCFGTV